MSAKEDLKFLLKQRAEPSSLDEWVIGKIPHHIRRLWCPDSEPIDLAILGAKEIAKYFDEKLFYCQALIAGALLSNKYSKLYIISPSQYGKSWLLGRLALILAANKKPVYITGATGDVTNIIMQHLVQSLSTVHPSITEKLLTKKSQIEKLQTSLSKQKIAFTDGGFVEPVSLGDSFNDNLQQNKGVGRSGYFIVDEAALVSDKSIAELGRREFSNIDQTSYPMIQISNPHTPGTFYNNMIEEEPDEHTFILWLDALTAVEEERYDAEQVINSDFAKNESTCRRYLLCELETMSQSMFVAPQVYSSIDELPTSEYTYNFLGIDAAYRGKDNISVARVELLDEGLVCCPEIYEIKTPQGDDWEVGETSAQILDDIATIARHTHAARVCVDIGYGVWMVEGLAQRGVPVVGINFASKPTPGRVSAGHYAAVNAQNLRAEMHLDIQNILDNNRLIISEEAYSQIKEVLPHVGYERKASGKIQIRPKSEIKARIGHSPDTFDSLLLGVHAAITFMGEEI